MCFILGLFIACCFIRVRLEDFILLARIHISYPYSAVLTTESSMTGVSLPYTQCRSFKYFWWFVFIKVSCLLSTQWVP